MTEPESTPSEDAIPSKEALAEVFPGIFKADEPTAPPAGDKAAEASTEVKPPEDELKSKVDEYLSMEDLGDKLAKVKVSGQEKEVTFRELVKGFQTEAYLSQKGDRLAKAVKNFEATKEPVVPYVTTTSQSVEEDDYFKEHVKPHLSDTTTEVQSLKQELSAVKDAMQPFQYQGRVDEIDRMLKSQGYDDFKKLLPQVEMQIMGMPVEQQAAMDTPAGFMNTYKDLKIQAMQKQAEAVVKTPKVVDKRVVPKVEVESGSSVSSPSEDSRTKYNAAFQKARQSGRDADWADVLKIHMTGSG